MTKRSKISAGDVVHSLVKGAISAIPIAGGLGAELFNLIIAPPLAKRRDEWLDSIACRLEELEKRIEGFKIESLSQNESFISTVMQATQVAMRNHQEEKLEALRNAVVNSALPSEPDDNLIMIFINYIDTMTDWHIKILCFFNDPIGWYKENNVNINEIVLSSPAQALEVAFNELKGKREFYSLIVKELFNKGLMNTESLMVTMTPTGATSPRTTSLGKAFIEFISAKDFGDNTYKK